MRSNSFCTILPDSEKYRENNECELTCQHTLVRVQVSNLKAVVLIDTYLEEASH